MKHQDLFTSLKKVLLIVVGVVSVGLGVLGIVLPILPTTPFLLLAAACFVRSSDRFYHWLLNHPWFGKYIRNYREGKGIPLKVKIIAIAMLWLAISYSALFVVPILGVKILLFGIAIGVTVHLISVKTLKEEKM